MMLAVPNVKTLTFALASGLIPGDVAAKPATVSRAGDGFVLDVKWRATKKQKADLTAIGVAETDRHIGDAVAVAMLFPLVPLERDPKPPLATAQTAVLFRLHDPNRLADIVTELIRLGNDRQSYRWLGGTESPTILLRVVNPPYYTLLRAIDRLDGDAVTAFIERAPRVWVPIGFDHPFAAAVRPAEGQLAIVAPSNDWQTFADEPFRDIYELLTFPIDRTPTVWEDAGPLEPIAVPLRLAPGDAAAVPEFWVLPDAGFADLDAFVRDADERLIRRLRFAVGRGGDGTQRFLLRVAPSKLAAPTLAIAGAVGYVPYWKLPNLFLPVGSRLHPTLRRESVRGLLADDPSLVTWLDAEGDGRFLPRSIAENSFRPLEGWVDYTIERFREPIAAWIDATTFDFGAIQVGDGTPRPPRPPRKADRRPEPVAETKLEVSVEMETVVPPPPADVATRVEMTVPAPPPTVRTSDEWDVRRKELESQFLSYGDVPLDDPRRAALWPELARCHAKLGDATESANCYLQALVADPDGSAAMTREWATGLPANGGALPAHPTPSQAIAVLATALASGSTDRDVRDFLVANEHQLPIRGIWLYHREWAKRSGSDLLGLTRVRDRLFARLHETGLSAERDLPRFLRYAGLVESERGRVVLDKARSLRETVRRWTEATILPTIAKSRADIRNTLAVVELIFAYVLTSLDATEEAGRLLANADATFAEPMADGATPAQIDFQREAIPIIRDAYRARIDDARAGRPLRGPIAPTIKAAYEAVAHPPANSKSPPPIADMIARFVLAKTFEESVLIDPTERKHAVDTVGRYESTELKAVVLALDAIPDAESFARQARTAVRERAGDPNRAAELFNLLHRIVPMAARVGEAFALELLDASAEFRSVAWSEPPKVVPDKDRALWSDRLTGQGELIERSLRLLACYDRARLRTMLGEWKALLKALPADRKFKLLAAISPRVWADVHRAIPGPDRIEWLQTAERELFGARPPVAPGPGVSGHDRLDFHKALLLIAAGWGAADRADECRERLSFAEAELRQPHEKINPPLFIKLLQAYIRSAGMLPPEDGLGRIEAILQAIPVSRTVNQSTNVGYLSQFHVMIAEAVALAIVADSTAGSLSGRRWRDEEEHRVRTQMTADLRAMT
jgi:tetratricopeptide (TPR) repeat protein